MSATIEIDVDKILQSKSEKIKSLKLIIKELEILLTASTLAEKRLMDGVREHKARCLDVDSYVFPADMNLWKLLGEGE